MADEIPPEIWVYVFHKLPLRVVTRCKLICKQWCSLVSDPSFTTNYNPLSIPNHPESLLTIHCTWNTNGRNQLWMNTYEINNPGVGHPLRLVKNFTPRSNDLVTVLGSYNGLVALYRGSEFCLFNPVTREQKAVRAKVGVDQRSCHYGLCHDPARDEYKAVLYDPTRFGVVSFKDGSSKTLESSELSRLGGSSSGNSTIHQGVPHWPCRSVILYFDPLMEEFRTILFPEKQHQYELGTYGGKLTATLYISVHRGFEVWALEAENSWSLLFVLDYHLCPLNSRGILYSVSILAWVTHQEVLIHLNHDWWMIYNLTNRSWRPVGKTKKTRYHQILTYIPTLVSPNR